MVHRVRLCMHDRHHAPVTSHAADIEAPTLRDKNAHSACTDIQLAVCWPAAQGSRTCPHPRMISAVRTLPALALLPHLLRPRPLHVLLLVRLTCLTLHI